MPIFEYVCDACGAKNEHLQKHSDQPLTVCPKCGKASYHKIMSAAGFQLKGGGWYETDFKNGANHAARASEPPPCVTGEGSCASCAAH